MAAKRMRLTDAGVAKLRPSAKEYTIQDTKIAGLGVRVRPSGHRSFVYYRKGPEGPCRIALGSTAMLGVEETRRRRVGIAAGVEAPAAARGAVSTFAEFVAGPWAEDRARCKPSTRKMENAVLRNRLPPAFGATPLDRIGRADVARRFDAYSRAAPGGANRALAMELIGTNPARGSKRNPRPKLARFLSRGEVRRLHRALDALAAERPARRQQAAIIRLLPLTGCRRGEIAGLRWQEVDGDTLGLADAKTGPRPVFLAAEARAVLDRQPRAGSAYVFPSPADPSKPRYRGLSL